MYYKFSWVDYYDTIYSTPCWVWNEINEKKEYNLLIKGVKKFGFITKKPKHPKFLKREQQIAENWGKILDEYIIAFPPEKYLKRLKKRHEIARMRFDAVANDERHLNTIATLEEEKLLSDIKNDKVIEKSDFNRNCALMQKELGIVIKSREISIFDYYNNLNALNYKNGS